MWKYLIQILYIKNKILLKKSNTYFYDNKYNSKLSKSRNTCFIKENSQIFQNYNPSMQILINISEWNKKIIQ